MRHEKALSFAMNVAKPPARPTDFAGTWKNQLGSKMTLVHTGDALTGQYLSVVSGSGSSIQGDLVGWASGRMISFSVNWVTPSITSWIGHLVTENGKDVVETLWQMATELQAPADPNELWENIFAGADRFERI